MLNCVRVFYDGRVWWGQVTYLPSFLFLFDLHNSWKEILTSSRPFNTNCCQEDKFVAKPTKWKICGNELENRLELSIILLLTYPSSSSSSSCQLWGNTVAAACGRKSRIKTMIVVIMWWRRPRTAVSCDHHCHYNQSVEYVIKWKENCVCVWVCSSMCVYLKLNTCWMLLPSDDLTRVSAPLSPLIFTRVFFHPGESPPENFFTSHKRKQHIMQVFYPPVQCTRLFP